ncbi:MAG: phosphate ABC transporter permease subunit PstC [Spirochaetaceae bacterium]|jgi:phosphate transport system permease protein|nr:phosphate ABC transporter permease subunit PstC [Spirochaetaceae bacterium]
MQSVFRGAAVFSVAVLLLICLYFFAGGLPAVGKIGLFPLVLGKEWAPSDVPPQFGILPMILGSLYVTVGAMIFGIPVGIFSAVFLAGYCPARLYRLLKPAAELLAGIPSVVYGFFGLIVLVPLVRGLWGGTGMSLLTASAILGIMILPTIIAVSEAAVRAVPPAWYENARALGASRERSLFFVVLPAAGRGIGAGIILGIGRAVGETMAVIMVAGNQARLPAGILKGVRTLTANIVIEMGYAADLHRGALFATALVLFVLVLLLNLTVVFYKGA